MFAGCIAITEFKVYEISKYNAALLDLLVLLTLDNIVYALNAKKSFLWFQFDLGWSNYSCLLLNWC